MLQTLYIVIIIIIYIYYIISTCICIVRCQLYIYIDMLRPWWSVCHPSTDKWGFRRSICNVPWQNSELLGRRDGWQPRTLVYIYIYTYLYLSITLSLSRSRRLHADRSTEASIAGDLLWNQRRMARHVSFHLVRNAYSMESMEHGLPPSSP